MSMPARNQWIRPATVAHDIPVIHELRTQREALGLSLKDVGLRCGVDEMVLRNWEHGGDVPRLDAFCRWTSALNLKIAVLQADAASRGLSVDWQQRLAAVDGAAVRLTPMEWKVLERLAASPGQLVTHQDLFKHLYGEERNCRAQATAVRVLINKLRRLLPIRIEAQWGQGYVIDGIAPSQPQDSAEIHTLPIPGRNAEPAAAPQPRTAMIPARRPTPASRRASKRLANPLPSRPTLVRSNDSLPRAGMSAPPSPSAGREGELSVIERFLAERGVTRCPDPATVGRSSYADLVWDKYKRKWVRPAPPQGWSAV
jgi:DNA-binding winged helix-turn-helix (wHTH) protein